MSARIINGRRIRLERAYIWLPSGISMRTWRPTTTIQRKEKSDIPLYCSASKMANTPLWNAISEGRPSRALFQRNPQKTCQREPSFFLWNNKKKAARLRSIRPITASLGVFSFYLWKKGSLLYGIIQMSANGPGSVPPTYFCRFLSRKRMTLLSSL